MPDVTHIRIRRRKRSDLCLSKIFTSMSFPFLKSLGPPQELRRLSLSQFALCFEGKPHLRRPGAVKRRCGGDRDLLFAWSHDSTQQAAER